MRRANLSQKMSLKAATFPTPADPLGTACSRELRTMDEGFTDRTVNTVKSCVSYAPW